MDNATQTVTDTTVRANHVASGPSDRALFELTLQPYRALSRSAVKGLIAVFAVILIVAAARFFVIGAWPVALFLLLDLGLIALAIHISVRTGKTREVVTLTKTRLILNQTQLGQPIKIASMEPYWAKIDTKPRRRRPGAIILTSNGTELRFGHFLSDDDRLRVANTLEDALTRWRAGKL